MENYDTLFFRGSEIILLIITLASLILVAVDHYTWYDKLAYPSILTAIVSVWIEVWYTRVLSETKKNAELMKLPEKL